MIDRDVCPKSRSTRLVVDSSICGMNKLIKREICPKQTRKNRRITGKRTKKTVSPNKLGRPLGKKNSYQRVRKTKSRINKIKKPKRTRRIVHTKV